MVLCALSFLCCTATVAQAAPVIGTASSKGSFKVEGVTSQTGAQIENGARIQTGPKSVRVSLSRGGYVLIQPNSKVRVYDFPDHPVRVDIVTGGAEVHNVPRVAENNGYGPGTDPDQGEGPDQLPFNAAAGSGNFPFPSIGGGSSANSRLPIVNSSGTVIGYAITDSRGMVVGFTDASGRVLGSGAPNGTPISSIFGVGASFL